MFKMFSWLCVLEHPCWLPGRREVVQTLCTGQSGTAGHPVPDYSALEVSGLRCGCNQLDFLNLPMGFEIKLKSCCLSRGCENPTEAYNEVGFCLLLLLIRYVSSAGWEVITRRRWAIKCVLSMGMETCAKAERRALQWALAVAFANVSPACLDVPRGLRRALCYQKVLWEHGWINCKRLGDIKSKHGCICSLFQEGGMWRCN